VNIFIMIVRLMIREKFVDQNLTSHLTQHRKTTSKNTSSNSYKNMEQLLTKYGHKTDQNIVWLIDHRSNQISRILWTSI